jgi:hypothetical protein
VKLAARGLPANRDRGCEPVTDRYESARGRGSRGSPDCTEGPCAQDGPLILGAAVGALLLTAYFLAIVGVAVREQRGRPSETDHGPDRRGG